MRMNKREKKKQTFICNFFNSLFYLHGTLYIDVLAYILSLSQFLSLSFCIIGRRTPCLDRSVKIHLSWIVYVVSGELCLSNQLSALEISHSSVKLLWVEYIITVETHLSTQFYNVCICIFTFNLAIAIDGMTPKQKKNVKEIHFNHKPPPSSFFQLKSKTHHQ